MTNTSEILISKRACVGFGLLKNGIFPLYNECTKCFLVEEENGSQLFQGKAYGNVGQ